MCNDDKFLAVSIQEDSLLRLDIAGEKLMIDIEPMIKSQLYFRRFLRYYSSVAKNVRAKLNE